MSKDEIIQYIEEHFDEVYKESMEDCDDEEIFVYQYIIKKFKKEMEQEKEKNKVIAETLMEWINGERIYFNHISRDTIKQKIKELEEKSDYWNCDEIEVLKELLEE